MRRFLIVFLLIASFLFQSTDAWAIFIPPNEIDVTKKEIAYAELIWPGVKWDTSRLVSHKEIVLKLPKIKSSYSWSLEKDIGKNDEYSGLKVEWKTVYFGQGGDYIVDVSDDKEIGFYLNLINPNTGKVIATDTYIFRPGAGIKLIPPEERVFGTIDENGTIVSLHDPWGRPTINSQVYSTDYFPNRYVVFSDLKSNHWAYGVVEKIIAMGYLKGYPDSTFRPERNITRAEFMTIFSKIINDKYLEANIYNKKDISLKLFKDFNKKHWSYNAVDSLLQHIDDKNVNYILGSKYQPDKPITREEVVALTYAVMKNHNRLVIEKSGREFKDISKTKFKEGILFSFKQGFISGYPDNTFRPNGDITRAEAAAVLLNIINSL